MQDRLPIDIEIEEIMPTRVTSDRFVKIAIVGVGGAGCNMLNYMIEQQISRVDLIAINTDLQHLSLSPAPKKIQIGRELTRGLGAGSRPEVGRESALESEEEIKKYLTGLNIIFIAAGMGGGTGTGASPVVANIAKELGVKVVSVITKPFNYEGKLRRAIANSGYEELKKESDAIIVIENEKILEIDNDLTVQEAYNKVNNVLYQAVSGMIDVILNVSRSGMNADFADIQTMLEYKGLALMSIGKGKGEKAALQAIKEAINSPLLNNSKLSNAKGIIAHWTHNPKLSFLEINSAMQVIQDQTKDDTFVKFATFENDSFDIDELKLIIIATGFESNDEKISVEKTLEPQKQKKDSKPNYKEPPLARGYEIQYNIFE